MKALWGTALLTCTISFLFDFFQNGEPIYFLIALFLSLIYHGIITE